LLTFESKELKKFIDASFGTHADRNSHTGIIFQHEEVFGCPYYITKSTCEGERINIAMGCINLWPISGKTWDRQGYCRTSYL